MMSSRGNVTDWRGAGGFAAGPSDSLALNPTIVLFCGLLALGAVAVALYADGWLAAWQAGLLNVVVLYGLYTVSHESAHGLIHPSPMLNGAIGRTSAALEGITFPLYKILHCQHHAHTNDPVRDPDQVIGRKPRWLFPVWVLVRLLHDNSFAVSRGLWRGHRAYLVEHLVTVSIQAAVIITATVMGRFTELALLWLLPVVVSGLLVELTVAWLVHYPQESLHPLENSKMFRGRLSAILTLNQSLHLVHHLWPRTPWYRYGRLADVAEKAVSDHSGNAGL